mmetsp:Transcript_73861/g.229050  ORF Transcript_73861/g.229050 Transcript_73861/m.229050 type:complete len:255 (-) Transcript_73861:59-823(-)
MVATAPLLCLAFALLAVLATADRRPVPLESEAFGRDSSGTPAARALLSVRETSEEEEGDGQGHAVHAGKFKFGGKFGKIGKFGKFGKSGKFGKFGVKFGKFGGGKKAKKAKHHRNHPGYVGHPGGHYVNNPSVPHCNTACGAWQWEGHSFDQGLPQLEPHQCARCKWQLQTLSSCHNREKLAKSGMWKACCIVYDRHPRCPAQRQQGPRVVTVVASVRGPAAQPFFDYVTGMQYTVQVPPHVQPGQAFQATIPR